jgi:hypothetical protein
LSLLTASLISIRHAKVGNRQIYPQATAAKNMKVSSCAVALYLKLDKTNTSHCRPKKDAALVGLSEFFKLKLDKAEKLLPLSRQNRWIFLPGLGSL